jgi:hypothetical protein
MHAQTDTAPPPLTGRPRLIQIKEEEMALIPEKVQRALENGNDPIRLQEWAAERSARLTGEIAALRAKIAARQLQASGHPTTAPEQQVDNTHSLPSTQSPVFVDASVRVAYETALAAALPPPPPVAPPAQTPAPAMPTLLPMQGEEKRKRDLATIRGLRR